MVVLLLFEKVNDIFVKQKIYQSTFSVFTYFAVILKEKIQHFWPLFRRSHLGVDDDKTNKEFTEQGRAYIADGNNVAHTMSVFVCWCIWINKNNKKYIIMATIEECFENMCDIALTYQLAHNVTIIIKNDWRVETVFICLLLYLRLLKKCPKQSFLEFCILTCVSLFEGEMAHEQRQGCDM